MKKEEKEKSVDREHFEEFLDALVGLFYNLAIVSFYLAVVAVPPVLVIVTIYKLIFGNN